MLSKPGKLLGLTLVMSFFLSACMTSVNAGKDLTQPTIHQPSETSTIGSRPTSEVTKSPVRSTPGVYPTFTQTPRATLARTNAARSLTQVPNRRTATPTQADCLSQGGQIETGTLETKLLRLPLNFRVYTPPCYDLHRKQRYPVLYLFHGQSYADDQWDRLGIDEVADRLIADAQIPPLIIVMPHDRLGGQPTETNFSQAITEVLLPYIDQTYRTLPDRVHRAVGGLSRGAGWAVHFAISEWELFGALGAHSAAVFHTDAQRMRTWLSQIPEDQYPRIYVDIGDKDRPEIMRSTLWFEDLLNLYDIPHEWHLFTGYHAEEYWKAHLEQYLRWYTQNW
jgi:enterochelin esterase-like enzyme